MKSRTLTYALLMLTAVTAYAQHQPRSLPELEVWGTRPLRDIGLEKSDIDSVALRDNIALSMADILAYNSALFVKNYGRATLSTVSFRGTSPSHTAVTWNGMNISNPMVGMTDFSTIPSFFIDRATLLHGSSSVGDTGGGLGGAVMLSSLPETTDSARLSLQYVQGIGSFSTFDEFLRASWTDSRWATSVRASYASSPNDYKYVNHDKKVNIYDSEGNITGSYHPVERNRSGAYRDFNVMGQVYRNFGARDRVGLDGWLTVSNRELPMLTTDYGEERDFENRQRENTVRAVASWNHRATAWSLNANAGYSWTFVKYDYSRQVTADRWSVMTRSRSRVHTFFGKADASWYASSRWIVTANASLHRHVVRSRDRNVALSQGGTATVGYDRARNEISAALSAKWKPVNPVGIAATLRTDVFGDKTALIPALFVDALVTRRGNVMLKGSVSRNHKFPSLNDLYFMPGGNPDLRDESGYTYDLGLSTGFSGGRTVRYVAGASANWFDSYIDDWILWLPTTKGFFSPRNVRRVHAYGVETHAHADILFPRDWTLSLQANYSWTPSVNRGEPLSEADNSVGKQLPYVPRHSASVTGRLSWRQWSLLYKWSFYSRRYTMTNSDISLTGNLPPYFMSNIVIQRDLSFRPLDLQLKLAVNNLFDEDYLSVLARPMPGINFEFFVSIIPRL